MLVTSVVGLLITAVGAIAAPGGHHPPPPPPPPPPSVGPVNQIQSISCSSGAAYCCTPETDGWGSNYFQCSNYLNSCNSIVVCCNSQANQGSASVQTCSAFGNTKVIYVN
ncbi:uncharacterized protein NECHADRAFT_87834 [Fusarium vanettenii 77-13-4]|uniref:Hydrophobin n=1 Tax=Fusarium vanettenii (strain ATCC MYA-4622 / CBS 123669 / FGSC 9596 / NRRL 45880 / 77-13-4) TaxID=660122 RepID=C7Z356_FUSV7|nr:uncharacterized protein NECHADRAFT_87834 [Fusarium vanettenii 77-13-4]EEU41772.1 predicted protein [Fusarium vanettenii 77-13-4]